MQKFIILTLLFGIIISQNSVASATELEPLDNSTNIGYEEVAEVDVRRNLINPGDQASVYLKESNSNPVQLLDFYNLDGKTTLRVDFDETSGPTSVYVVVQQKVQGSNFFENIPGAGKVVSLGDSVRAVNISSDLNTEIRIMAQWVAGSSGKATFSFYLT